MTEDLPAKSTRLSTLVLDGSTPQTLVTMTYDTANRPLTRTLGNGVQTLYGYDSPSNPAASMNRIAKITHLKSDLTTKLFELDYTAFDDNGNRTELVRTVFPFVDGRFGSGSRVNWEYDLTSQLVAERYKLANHQEFLSEIFENDDAGNRIGHDIHYFDQSRSATGSYNAANELTGLQITFPSASPMTVAFEHNKRGGRTKMTMNPSGQNPTVANYGYNEENSLTTYNIVAPGRQLNVTFAYSGGLRVAKQVTGYVTVGGQQQVYNTHKKYLLDGVDVLVELQVIGSNEVVTALHIPGVLSATLIEGGASVVRYQLHDAQGNTIGLVDNDQEVSTVYLQDSWGIPLVDTDCQTVSLASSPVQVESVPNPYRWGGAHGYYADEDVGMYLMGLRWYDAFTGRFITRDPIGFAAGDMNQYRPMGNNPGNNADPSGLDDTWGLGAKTFKYLTSKGASLAESATAMGPATLRFLGEEVPVKSIGVSNATWGDYARWVDPVAIFFAGAADTLTTFPILNFSLTEMGREAFGANETIDKSSSAYIWGERSGMGLQAAFGPGRLAYTASAKATSAILLRQGANQVNAATAVAVRESSKSIFNLGLRNPKNTQSVGKLLDEGNNYVEIIQKAGRTNPLLNAAGVGVTLQYETNRVSGRGQ